MVSRGMTALQGILLGTALSFAPALAQGEPDDVEALIDLARGGAAGAVLARPAGDLAAILATASDAQRAALVAALAPEQAEALVAALVAEGVAPGTAGDIISALLSGVPDPFAEPREADGIAPTGIDLSAILAGDPEAAGDPGALERIIALVLEGAPADALPQVAEALHAAIDSCDVEMAQAAYEGHVLASLAFDRRLADRLVALGNSCDEAFAERLARILVTLADEGGDEVLSSTIETALALEGGQMLRIAAALRGEVEVAALPVAADPAVPPAVIGGAGSSPAGLPATAPGRDAIFAAGGSGGGGLTGGTNSVTRLSSDRNGPRDVSETN